MKVTLVKSLIKECVFTKQRLQHRTTVAITVAVTRVKEASVWPMLLADARGTEIMCQILLAGDQELNLRFVS